MSLSLMDPSSPSFLHYKAEIKTQYRTKINEATKKEMLRCEKLFQDKKREAMRRRDEQNEYFYGRQA